MRLILTAVLLVVLLATPAGAQDIDVSQVNGLPQKLQALQDQINAAVATLNARISTIQTTPGPQGPAGAPGAQGPAGPAGPAGASADPAALATLQTQVGQLGVAISALAQQQEVYIVRDATGAYVGRVIGQSGPGTVVAASRASILLPPLGQDVMTFDVLYTVLADSAHLTLTPTKLRPLAQYYYATSDCTGPAFTALAPEPTQITYDPHNGNRVVTITPSTTFEWTASRQDGGPCEVIGGASRPVRNFTTVGTVDIVDRAATLNPSFTPPFDVQAVYTP